MIAPGEIRCFVGGHYELYAIENIFTTVWIPGRLVCKTRYNSKGDRTRIIEKMIETWKDIEITIRPDDIDADEAQMELAEAQIKG